MSQNLEEEQKLHLQGLDYSKFLEKIWEDKVMAMGQNLPTTIPMTSYWEANEANGKCPLLTKHKQDLRLASELTYWVAQGTHQLLFHKMWENADSKKTL